MKIIAALAFLGYAAATPMGKYEYDFIKFVANHNKSYATKEEYAFRLNEFAKNAAFVASFESDLQTVELNYMADWTQEEYNQLLGAKNIDYEGEYVQDPETKEHTVDWRKKGAVTPVKNQGNCGSSWAFSASGALEASHFQDKGVLTSFSEQQLIDCCTQGVGGCYRSDGCGSGFMFEALTYTQTYELEKESDYPYVGYNQYCHHRHREGGEGYTNNGIHMVEPRDKDAFKKSVAVGPTSISVEADSPAFRF